MQRNQSSGMESCGAVQWIHRYDNIDLWYDCPDGCLQTCWSLQGVPGNPSSSIICIWHWGNWMLFQNSRWECMMAGPIFTVRLIAASLWPMNMVISSTGQQRLRLQGILWGCGWNNQKGKEREEYTSRDFCSLPHWFDLLLCHFMDWLRVHDVACNYESIRFWQYSLFVGWGKYVSEGDRCRISMHMRISHAFIDGKPLADAFNNIQTALDELDFWVD